MEFEYERLQDHCQQVLVKTVEHTTDAKMIDLLHSALDQIEKVVLRSKVHHGEENVCEICKNVTIMSKVCCKQQNICWSCVHRVHSCPFCRRCIPSRLYKNTSQ